MCPPPELRFACSGLRSGVAGDFHCAHHLRLDDPHRPPLAVQEAAEIDEAGREDPNGDQAPAPVEALAQVVDAEPGHAERKDRRAQRGPEDEAGVAGAANGAR